MTSETPGPAPVPIPVLKRETLPGLFAIVDRLEVALGLPPRFLDSIFHEDDWSFVVKLHALIEGALTMLLTERIGGADGTAELRTALSYLDTSSRRVGKVKFATLLGVLQEDRGHFVNYLSELRNIFVHRIENVTLTLERHLASMDTNQRNNFVDAIIRISDVTRKRLPEWALKAAAEDAIKNPKIGLWIAGFIVLLLINMQVDLLKSKRRALDPHVIEQLEQILRDIGVLTDTYVSYLKSGPLRQG
jgi:hypothetical protein